MGVEIHGLEKQLPTQGEEVEEGEDRNEGREVNYTVYSFAGPPQGTLVRDFRTVAACECRPTLLGPNGSPGMPAVTFWAKVASGRDQKKQGA